MAWAEIAIELVRILAWPALILILAGWIYRRDITTVLRRISKLAWAGGSVELNENIEIKAVEKSSLDSLQPKLDKETQSILESLNLAEARILCDICAVGHRQRIDLTVFTVAAAGHERREIFRHAINKLVEQRLMEQRGRFYHPSTKGVEVAREYLRTVEESLRAKANTSPDA